MANWTPVIATRQGALPEFVHHLDNVLLLDLETTAIGEWIHQSSPDRATKRFERIFEDEVERMACDAFEMIVWLSAEPHKMRQMRWRKRARETCIKLFDSERASEAWDDTYERAFEEECFTA
jgi:glycosyltransferase involved in cell wall biosynthesis